MTSLLTSADVATAKGRESIDISNPSSETEFKEMIDLEKLALDPNTNTTNLHYDREKDGKNCVPTAPEAPGGLSKDLTHCQLDENNCPTVQNTDADDTSPTTADDEVSALKAELEVARRKLAEYEGSQQTNTQEPVRFRYRSAGRNLFPTADPLLPFSPDNVSVWSDTHVSHSEGSLAQIEPTNNTSPAATSPSTSPFAFKAPSLGTSVRTGLSDETKHDVGRPKNDNRGFSGPSLTPIGEPRRPMQQGSLSQDHRSPHNKQIWKAENDWNSVWPGVSSSSPPQQLTGTASLGLVYNDPLQWQNSGPVTPNLSQYTPYDQMDWRRLLDRSMSCSWDSVIEKVICQCDQQASLFLQQKLKVAPPSQKHEIVDAIVRHCYPLMINRFGNFLVQRCFEYGTKDHINGIAHSILGNVVTLATDMFGCHVIQKAFDCVDEDCKAAMVKELLCRIPETVCHRFACHVWQKLLEIRWLGAPPVIMKYVNDALKGMWTEVALGETGSLVVQNVFENCLDEDKRPCIEEILANVDTIARGQWGNWVIQHVIEHGAAEDRNRALDIVLTNAARYSMDQFASKVIEKMLKCCGADIFQTYISKVVEKEPGRPRVALIDISSDVYGNYLIQYILQNASQAVQDQITYHVRKHMVSLRGSRYGQRVAFQVERMKVSQQKSANWSGRWD